MRIKSAEVAAFKTMMFVPYSYGISTVGTGRMTDGRHSSSELFEPLRTGF